MWWKALLALVVAVALIIGVNYANDYSDGIRGTDDERAGPLRLVGSRVASPRAVLTAAVTSLTARCDRRPGAGDLFSNPWLIVVGAACIAGAWLYTGGSKPYGYHGFWRDRGVRVLRPGRRARHPVHPGAAGGLGGAGGWR